MLSIARVADVLIFLVFAVSSIIVDHVRREALTEQEKKDFYQLTNDVAERNLTANVAARALQGGLTVGGFLFAGLFAVTFQPALKAWSSDILIALFWTSVSLLAGAWNMASLPQQSAVKNVVLTRPFTILSVLQLASVLGAFARIGLLILKYMNVLPV